MYEFCMSVLTETWSLFTWLHRGHGWICVQTRSCDGFSADHLLKPIPQAACYLFQAVTNALHHLKKLRHFFCMLAWARGQVRTLEVSGALRIHQRVREHGRTLGKIKSKRTQNPTVCLSVQAVEMVFHLFLTCLRPNVEAVKGKG
jgi:hypothetical protein